MLNQNAHVKPYVLRQPRKSQATSLRDIEAEDAGSIVGRRPHSIFSRNHHHSIRPSMHSHTPVHDHVTHNLVTTDNDTRKRFHPRESHFTISQP